MNLRGLALVSVAGWLLGAPVAPDSGGSEGELLSPGEPPLPRSIGPTEKHVYRIPASTGPTVVVIDQRGIDLQVVARGPGQRIAAASDAPVSNWGTEVLYLEPSAGKGYLLEVRPAPDLELGGRYSIEAESFAFAAGGKRQGAFRQMSLAGQLQDLNRSLESYRRVQATWHELGDARWEAEVLGAMALLEYHLPIPKLADAIKHGEAALNLWRELRLRPREAAALRWLGIFRLDSGELAQARDDFVRSRDIWSDRHEVFEQTGAESERCQVLLRSAELKEAQDCFENVRSSFKALGVQSEEPRLLNSLGGVLDFLGDRNSSRKYYGEARALYRKAKNSFREAEVLNNIAVSHGNQGEWEWALYYYEEARKVLRSKRTLLSATRLNNLGFLYNSMEEPQRALLLLQGALRTRRLAGASRDEIITLNNLGVTQRKLEQFQDSVDAHQKALKLATKLQDRRQMAICHIRLGEVQLERQVFHDALAQIDSALTLLETGQDRWLRAQALHLRGRALAALRRWDEAVSVLRDALELRRDIGDRVGEAESLGTIAAVERSLGRAAASEQHARDTLELVEKLRLGFVSPDLRATFLATQHQAYGLLIDLLMDRNEKWEALQISEQARARSLLDGLYAEGSASDRSAMSARLRERRQELRSQLNAAVQRLRTAVSESESEAWLGRVRSLQADLDEVERQVDPLIGAARQSEPIRWNDITQLLDSETLLLEYWVGENRSYLWAVSPKNLRCLSLPSRKAIEKRAREAYAELTKVEIGAGSRPQQAKALSEILLKRVWPEVSQARRLILVVDADLAIIPFAALPVPGPGQDWKSASVPLLETHETVYLPSATTLHLVRDRLKDRTSPDNWAAVIADPVFDSYDTRLPVSPKAARRRRSEDPLSQLTRLSQTRKEATIIESLAPKGRVRTLLDFAASRDTVLADGALHSYRIVHFATHGVGDTSNSDLFGLVLSRVDKDGHPRDGLLGPADIYRLKLSADLVVLSGCNTALGKKVHGEGLMGLTRGFLYAGVPTVVGSLWRAREDVTPKLMERFYREMWDQHRSPAEALRKAQLAVRQSAEYRQPYFWASFVLQGDWRAPAPPRSGRHHNLRRTLR